MSRRDTGSADTADSVDTADSADSADSAGKRLVATHDRGATFARRGAADSPAAGDRVGAWGIALTLAWIAMLGAFFAMVEIQIEGSAGWAANLPTWRIEHHWLLDIFWGGRPMTGYHAWVFPFMALFFHYSLVMMQRWSLRLEARALASIMLFWIVEDYLWFVFNPAFGIAHFSPAFIPWHKHWFLFAPTDYWVSLLVAAGLFFYSYKKP